MLANCKRIVFPVRLLALLLALPCLGLPGAPLPALAQNSVRGAVAAPAPQAMDKAATQQAAENAEASEAKTAEPQAKFPNKDTAKNRRDYDMGTETGSIRLGRDEDTGDTVMRHKPPKKAQQPTGLEGMPIEVRPIIVR
ncbi:hypothetical protein [Humidesulfovibrio sp.]